MRTQEIEELRPLTALRLLTIWQESREMAEDPLERSLLCNARILLESCYAQGAAVFSDEQAVLKALTGRQMEMLLHRLANDDGEIPRSANPNFDMARFEKLGE